MPFKKFQILLIFVFCFFSCGLFAQTEVNKYLHEIQSVKSDTDKVRLYAKIGDYYKEASSFDSAMYYYNAALRITESPAAAESIAKSINIIGIEYAKSSSYDKALKCFVVSLIVVEKLNNKKCMGDSYMNIGSILTEQQDYRKAPYFYYKALRLYKEAEDNEGIMNCCLNISVVNIALKNFDKAMEYSSFALQIAKKTNDKYGMLIFYKNIGDALVDQSAGISDRKIACDKLKKAEGYLIKALKIYRDPGNTNKKFVFLNHTEAYILINLSVIYKNLKMYGLAIYYGESSLKLSERLGILALKPDVYNNLYEIYKDLGKYKEALKYHVLFKRTNDSVYNLDKSQQINELYVKLETEKEQKKIAEQKIKLKLLRKEREVENYKRSGLVLLTFIVVILGFGLFLYLKRKIQSEKQVYEHEVKFVETQKIIADKELDNQKLKSIQLQDELKYKDKELEYKNREIINLALHISEKNDFLSKVKTKLKKSSDQAERKQIVRFINCNIITLEKEKQEFNAYIENINQSFFARLREKFPDITKMEERLTVLLKLNLSSKEISAILNINAKSVEVSRYRLRKKLGLNKDEHLADFLNSI